MRRRSWKKPIFWVNLWAMAILTSIVVHTLGLTSTAPLGGAFAGVLQAVGALCGTIVLAYVGGNQAIDHKHGPEMEDKESEQ